MNEFLKGSGSNGEWTYLDILGFVGFIIGLQNLNLNIGQETFDNQTRDIDEAVNNHIKDALAEIHEHLKKQDEKMERLLKLLEGGDEENKEVHGTNQG